jgi:hypothetical protein
MTLQTFIKGILMLIISVLVTGFSQTPVDFALMGVTAVASVLAFTGTNLTGLINSATEPGQFNWADALGALLVAVAASITEYIALIVVEHQMIWPVFFKVVGSATLTYIATTLFSGPKSKSKKLFV